MTETLPPLVDSHCHLDDAQFDLDRAEVIARARQVGLKYLLAIGTGNGPPDLQAAVRLAEAYPFIFATAGVHPNDAQKCRAQTFKDLEQLLRHPKVVAVGEIGLDYHWGVPKELQEAVLFQQLTLAAEALLPIVIHTRDAWEDTIRVLRDRWADTRLPAIMHCFTGTPAMAEECLKMGFYLSFGGITTFPKAADIREATRLTPADRLLLETDCPYLAPAPYRGKRNEPSYVVHTAQAVAEARAVSLEELAQQTTDNFVQLFRLKNDLLPAEIPVAEGKPFEGKQC